MRILFVCHGFRYILSGFELELYSQHEYPYLFWYLYELLFPWLTNCLQRADSCLQEHELSLESQQKTAGKNKKKVKGGSGKKNKSTPRPYAREIAHYQGYGILCAGYFKVRRLVFFIDLSLPAMTIFSPPPFAAPGCHEEGAKGGSTQPYLGQRVSPIRAPVRALCKPPHPTSNAIRVRTKDWNKIFKRILQVFSPFFIQAIYGDILPYLPDQLM